MLRLLRKRDSRQIAVLDRPSDFLRRNLGLLVRSPLSPGEGLWLDPCGSIHMFGVRSAIDVLFLDSELRVLRVSEEVRPWQVRLAPRGTRSVVELPAGAASGLRPGDELTVEERAPEK